MNVLTLVHGRRNHLTNLIRGLEGSIELPDALVIVQMNEEKAHWKSCEFPVIHRMVSSGHGGLPLAAARNEAVRHAPGRELVFLDVDCIPDIGLITQYRAALATREEAVFQGETVYLPPGAVSTETSTQDLKQMGMKHPVHQGHQAGEVLPHQLFWSLNFACRRETFERLGGFDERYQGYGGEDTDFAFHAAACGVPIKYVAALAFHQFHPSFDPPLNHLASIVANARLFRQRWGTWPMGGWLGQFADAGYISVHRDHIALLREPSKDELALCEIKPDV